MGKVKDAVIAIIGNGCAAAECLSALRENGFKGEIHIFSDSRLPIYNPMLITYYVADKISYDNLFTYGNNTNYYDKHRARLHFGSPVDILNAKERTIKNRDNYKLRFDQCLIASGATPYLPIVPGIDSNRVFTMKTIEDAINLKKAMRQGPKRALVIGTSMIAIKVVELFYSAGMEVCVCGRSDRIFRRTAHSQCSKVIQERMEALGIKFKLLSKIKGIEETTKGVQVYFENDRETEKAEVLVMCSGVRSNMGFVNRDQIVVQQGVIINDNMETNISGIYAAGDVAQGKNLLSGRPEVIGLLGNARYQGRTAGRNMAGVKDTYFGSIPYNITSFLDMIFVSIGDISDYTRTANNSDGNRFVQLFWKDELLCGANLIDASNESGIIRYRIIKELLQNKNATRNYMSDIHDSLIKTIY